LKEKNTFLTIKAIINFFKLIKNVTSQRSVGAVPIPPKNTWVGRGDLKKAICYLNDPSNSILFKAIFLLNFAKSN